MSQINRYAVLNKPALLSKKARIRADRVADASAPGIPGAADASNGRRNSAVVRGMAMRVNKGDEWDCRRMYSSLEADQ